MSPPKEPILQLVPSLGGAGAETQLGYLCRALVDRGWPVHVGHLVDGDRRPLFENSGARLHLIRSFGNYDPLIMLRIITLIRALRPALVQTWIPMMDVLGGASARSCGVPWILTERSSPQMFVRGAKFWLRSRLARGAAHIVSNSDGGAAFWSGEVPRDVSRSVIGNALPLEALDQEPPAALDELGIPQDAPVLLYVGRLTALKNVRTLVEALGQVVERSRAVALLCGAGDLEEEIRGWIDARSLSNRILMVGFRHDVAALLKRATLSVSLSSYEGMPNAVMEAAALACPLVVSDIPAHREVLPGEGALFVDPADVHAVAGAMLDVIERPEQASARATKARRLAFNWTIDAAADRYEEIYHVVMEAARGRK